MKATMKVLALLLVAVMMIGMFAGCQNNPTTTTTTPAGDGTTAGPDVTTQAPTTVDKTNAHTLKVMVMNSIGGDYDMKEIDNLEIWTYAKELLAAYGVTLELEVIESDQYVTALQTTLAGKKEDLPDLMFVYNLPETLRLQAADNGLLATLQDILVYSDGTASAFYEEYPLYMARSAYNGKNYWFGEYQEVKYEGISYGIGAASPSGVTVREDWINKLGWTELPDTLEELEAFILECQEKDVNENGLKDEIYCANFGNTKQWGYLNTWFGVGPDYFNPNLQTGNVDVIWESENIKDLFEFVKDWIAKGIIPTDLLMTGSRSPWYKNNKAVCMATYFCDNWSITAENCPVPEGDGTPILVGLTPDLTAYPDAYIYRDANPTMDNRCMMVSSGADLEAVAHVLDVLFSDEWNEMLQWGKEGYSYEVDDSGNKVYINGAGDHTSLATPGNAVHGRPVISFGIFPDVWTDYDLLEDAALCTTDLMKSQFDKATLEYEVRYTGQSTGYLAVATPEEQEIIDLYENDFKTLSDTLYMDILLGNISLDDWDTAVIEPLNGVGMQELKEVYQARFDRFYAVYESTLEG